MSTQPDRMAAEADKIYDGVATNVEYATEVKTQSGTTNVVRFVEGSNEFRRYFVSWFLCDDEVIRSFIIENDSEGKGILARLLGDSSNFYLGGYLESKKGQFGKVNVHQAADPELFKRITEYWNPSYRGNATARPRKEYVYNVIHRNPEEDGSNWCIENKHTKLMRIGPKQFKNLRVVRDNDGELTGYDVVFSKTGTGKDTVHTVLKAGLQVEHKVVGDITEDEKKYDKYDLDYEIRLSTATYILKFLRITIERIDSVMNTNYMGELEKQRVIEQENYKASTQGITQRDQDTNTTIPNRIPTNQTHAEQKTSSTSESSLAPSRIPANVTTEKCGHCGENITAGSSSCPKCGGVLQSACDICHKMFSVFEKVCPHCGQEYQTNFVSGSTIQG